MAAAVLAIYFLPLPAAHAVASYVPTESVDPGDSTLARRDYVLLAEAARRDALGRELTPREVRRTRRDARAEWRERYREPMGADAAVAFGVGLMAFVAGGIGAVGGGIVALVFATRARRGIDPRPSNRHARVKAFVGAIAGGAALAVTIFFLVLTVLL